MIIFVSVDMHRDARCINNHIHRNEHVNIHRYIPVIHEQEQEHLHIHIHVHVNI